MALEHHGPQHPLPAGFPASSLSFLELNPPHDSFILIAQCDRGQVRWNCLNGACVTSATFPGEELPRPPPPSELPGREQVAATLATMRGQLVATIDAACAGGRCSSELTAAVEPLRAAPRESVRRRGARTLFNYQSNGAVYWGDVFERSRHNPDSIERERARAPSPGLRCVSATSAGGR